MRLHVKQVLTWKNRHYYFFKLPYTLTKKPSALLINGMFDFSCWQTFVFTTQGYERQGQRGQRKSCCNLSSGKFIILNLFFILASRKGLSFSLSQKLHTRCILLYKKNFCFLKLCSKTNIFLVKSLCLIYVKSSRIVRRQFKRFLQR